MARPVTSPLGSLVTSWRAEPPRNPDAAREELYTATLSELRETPFDPMHCPRFLWLNQKLQIIEGTRQSIDTEVTLLCNLNMDSRPLTDLDLNELEHEHES